MARLLVLTSCVLLILRLMDVIRCPWWVVFVPGAVGLAIASVIALVVLVIAVAAVKEEAAKKTR